MGPTQHAVLCSNIQPESHHQPLIFWSYNYNTVISFVLQHPGVVKQDKEQGKVQFYYFLASQGTWSKLVLPPLLE